MKSPAAIVAELIAAGDAIRAVAATVARLSAMPDGPDARRMAAHTRKARRALRDLRSALDAIACAIVPEEADADGKALRVAFGAPLAFEERLGLIHAAAGDDEAAEIAWENLENDIEDDFQGLGMLLALQGLEVPGWLMVGACRGVQMRVVKARVALARCGRG